MLEADTFRKIADNIIGHEGGWVDDPDDMGGETAYGITKRTYNSFRKQRGEATVKNMKKFTRDDAYTFYFYSFWDKHNLSQLDNPSLAVVISDFFMGGSSRWKVFRAIMHQLSVIADPATLAGDSVSVKGIPITKWLINVVNDVDHKAPGMIQAFIALWRVQYYIKRSRVGNNAKYLRGWVARALSASNLEGGNVEQSPWFVQTIRSIFQKYPQLTLHKSSNALRKAVGK